MYTNRISAAQRGMMEIEVRRAAGYRAVAAMAVLGLITMMAVGNDPAASGTGALGLHTETYEFQAPATLGEEYRRETIAVAPATGRYEEPELVVQHEVHG